MMARQRDIEKLKAAAASLPGRGLSEADLVSLIAEEVDRARAADEQPALGYDEIGTEALLDERKGIVRMAEILGKEFSDVGHLAVHLAAIDEVLRARGVTVDEKEESAR